VLDRAPHYVVRNPFSGFSLCAALRKINYVERRTQIAYLAVLLIHLPLSVTFAAIISVKFQNFLPSFSIGNFSVFLQVGVTGYTDFSQINIVA
jgi:hypothetical protein